MKKIALALFVVFIILNSVFYINGGARAEINKMPSTEKSFPVIIGQESQQNISEIALVKIFLKNGSILNYTTLDDAVEDFYEEVINGRLSTSDILNISVMRFQDYLAILQNNTSLNQTEYFPGYKLFFSILANSDKYNYSGSIVAVDGREFLYNTYGDRLTKCFMYGRLSDLKIIDVSGEEVAIQDDELVILSYINTNDTVLSKKVTSELNKTATINPDVKIIIIDVANRLNESSSYVKNYKNLYFSNDFNTSIKSNTTGSFNSFGFIVTPSYVYVKGDLYVVRKSMGYEQADLINQYINVLARGDKGLFSYIINDVLANNLVEGEKANINVRIDDGFSNVTLGINYVIINKNNETLDSGKIEKLVQKSGWVSFKIDLPNASYALILTISTYSDELSGSSIVVSFTIKEKEKKEREPGLPWDLITGIILLLVLIIAIGSYAYRYTTKEKYKKVRRKKKVRKK